MQALRNLENSSEDREKEEMETPQPKRDKSKIYFFIIALLALVATNTYFYLKYKNTTDYTFQLSNEKVLMQEEINQIEAELNRLSEENMQFSEALKNSQDSVRNLIGNLRTQLKSNNLSQQDLAKAQEEITVLRQNINSYKVEIADLKENQNDNLTEQDRLRKEIQIKDEQLAVLTESHDELEQKIEDASYLQVSKINLLGLRDRGNGRENVENKFKKVDKIRIEFALVENNLVKKGMKNVYLRIIDPNGNLCTDGNNFFHLNTTPMQYTTMTEINFTNLGENYVIDWVDLEKFKKGVYTILLYTENSTMGRASIVLN